MKILIFVGTFPFQMYLYEEPASLQVSASYMDLTAKKLPLFTVTPPYDSLILM